MYLYFNVQLAIHKYRKYLEENRLTIFLELQTFLKDKAGKRIEPEKPGL